MKYKILFIFIVFIFLCASFAFAFDLILKLPYESGESYYVTRGYNTPGTHLGKDKYALDFTLKECDAFNQPVLVITDGIVIKVETNHKPKEERSYGNQVVIDHGNGIASRYAHLNKVLVKKGDKVEQGDSIGTMGNTGSCEGSACPEHEGTHLHFALYKKENGKYVGVKPEPMSGYTGFASGNRYKSDNKVFVKNEEDENKKIAAKNNSQENNQGNNQSKNTQNNNRNAKSGFWNSAGNFVKGFTENAVNSFMSVPKAIKNIGERAGNKIVDVIKLGDSRGDKLAGNNNKNQEIPLAPFYKGGINKNSGNSEKTFEEKYNSKLVAQAAFGVANKFGGIISLSAGQEITLSAQYKNIGSESWNKNNTSLNYVGFQTKQFYHPSWITSKRPSRLDQNIIKENGAGGFTFPIKAPDAAGLYAFSARPVIFINGSYEWLGDDVVSWNIAVAPKLALLEEIPPTPFYKKGTANKENEKGEVKGVSDVKDNKNDGLEKNKKEEKEEKKETDSSNTHHYFGGGSGDGSSPIEENTDEEKVKGVSDENNTNEEDCEIPETYLEECSLELTNENFAEFSFSSSVEDAIFECGIDGEEFVECENPIKYESLENGEHKFEVKSISNGVEDPTPSEHIWVVDTIAPNKINDLEAKSIENSKVNLSWTFPESDTYKMNLYYNQNDECGSIENMLNESSKTFETLEIIFSEEDSPDISLSEENIASFEIINLEKGKNYCFAITTADAAGNTSEISNIAGAAISARAEHIVISEIQFMGSTANDEFIELYNPMDEDIDLYQGQYSIQYLRENHSKSKKRNFNEGNVILSHGFFLIANKNWKGDIVPDLVNKSFNLTDEGGTIFLVKSKNFIKLKNEEINYENVVDYVSYVKEFGNKGSIERKANQYSTSESILEIPDKYGGNAFDSDDDIFDFILREIPDPQNTGSLKEPHQSQPPEVEITSPKNNTVFMEGETIKFTAEISDLEDGKISDEDIIWKNSGIEIGKGAEIEINNLSNGVVHNITLEVTDSDGEITTEEITVKIISSEWSKLSKISDLFRYEDIESFSVDMDENGNAHIALAVSDYCGESDDCDGEVILYQTNLENENFSIAPEIILNVKDYKKEHNLSGISKLILKVDSKSVIHIVFQAYDSASGTENVYYANSSDDYGDLKRVIWNIYDFQFDLGADNSLHIAAIKNENEIFYSWCMDDCLKYENWPYGESEESYMAEDVSKIYSLSMEVGDNNDLHIAFLTEGEESPVTLASKNKKILLACYAGGSKGFNIYYLNRNFVSASWAIEKIDGGYSDETIPRINIIESQPAIIINDNDSNFRLFLKNGDGVWNNTSTEPKILVDIDFSSSIDPQNYIHVVSTDYSDSNNLKWITNFPNGDYKTISFVSIQKKLREIYTPKLSIGDGGKAGIIFKGRDRGDGKYNVYYLEKELY